MTTDLECPCCGDVGALSDAEGQYYDGQGLICGCPGHVCVEEDGDVWINSLEEEYAGGGAMTDMDRRLLELAAEIARLRHVLGTFIAWSGSTADGSLSRADLERLLGMLDSEPKKGLDD